MKIAVIGANGKSGKIFINRALAAGHTITAGVRHPPLDISSHAQLTTVRCDATKSDDVLHLVTGHDAVVSLLGHVRSSPPDVQAISIRNAIAAMQQAKVKRLVSLTGTGVRYPDDKIRLIDRIITMFVQIIDSPRILDGRKHAELLATGNLDWTIIRVLKLDTNRPRPYQLRLNGPTKLTTSRHEVAQAILEVLEDDSFIRQAPIISK